jgi:glycosyltransferase involved in cell wall biosynthesis
MRKYSVIVPCYKESESDFRRCLDSIKKQTLQPYEVICVDDCSPSETPKIAIEYGFKYIRHDVNKNNGGARNTGIKESSGDYLVFVNADDYILPETLEKIDKANEGQDLILIGFRAFGKWNETFIPSKETTPYYTKLGWNGEPLHIVRRQFIIDNNLYEDENVVFADISWSKRVEDKIKTYGYVAKALYQFQTGNANSLTTKVSNGELL